MKFRLISVSLHGIHDRIETTTDIFLLEHIFNVSAYMSMVNPIALRKAKIVCNFGLSECNRVNQHYYKGGQLYDLCSSLDQT